jgi:hypothetical protein
MYRKSANEELELLKRQGGKQGVCLHTEVLIDYKGL